MNILCQKRFVTIGMDIKDNWLQGEVETDLGLKNAVAKARIALSFGIAPLDENTIHKIWEDIDWILDKWTNDNTDRPIKTLYDLAFNKVSDPIPRWKYADVRFNDDSDLLKHILSTKYPFLENFFESESELGLAWATVVLHEAAKDNIISALKAFIHMSDLAFKPIVSSGLAILEAQKKGGKKTGELRKNRGNETKMKVLAEAQKLIASKHEKREIAGIIARIVDISPQQVRRILKQELSEH